MSNPDNQSAAISGRSFPITRGGLCVSVLLKTLDTPIKIQRVRKLGDAFPVKASYEKLENFRKNDWPNHKDKFWMLSRLKRRETLAGIISSFYSETGCLQAGTVVMEKDAFWPLQCDSYIPEVNVTRANKINEEAWELDQVLLGWRGDLNVNSWGSHRAPGQSFCMFEKGRSDVQTVKMRNLEGLNKTHKGKKLTWNDAAEESFQRKKRELCEASLLGIPTENGRYVLDTDASVVAIFWIHHQEQEYNEKAVLRSIAYGSIVLSIKEIKYGVANRRSPRVTFWWPEDTTPKEAIGNAHKFLVKSKLAREALKAKGYDLEEVEEGKAVVEHELMRFYRSWRTKSPWTRSEWTMSLKPR